MNGKSTRITGIFGLGLAAAAGLAVGLSPSTGGAAPVDPYADLPATMNLTGVVRDVKELSETNGHADFERDPSRGFGHYVNQVADTLDADGKPVFRSTGNKVLRQWKDSQGRNIMPPRNYIASKSGDVAGSAETTMGGSLTTSVNFGKWYRDTAGTNLSAPLNVTLTRRPNSNIYTFDDKTDSVYSSRGGFFPINGELLGNSRGESKNFHFTYEIATRFVFKRGAGQVFTFTGDDDVYVFIDGKLVIDLGGVHSAVSQTIDLDRLTWLEDAQTYTLKFFFAERHRTQSNFRIDTTLTLLPAELPATTALAD